MKEIEVDTKEIVTAADKIKRIKELLTSMLGKNELIKSMLEYPKTEKQTYTKISLFCSRFGMLCRDEGLLQPFTEAGFLADRTEWTFIPTGTVFDFYVDDERVV